MKVFFITSCIKTVDAPLSYAPIRSVFSHEERFVQTLATIDSIKFSSPDSKIFLYEMTNIPMEWARVIHGKVDRFVSFAQSDDEELRNAHAQANKSNAEALYTKEILEDIRAQFPNMLDKDRVCKLSGRYLLNASTYNDRFSDYYGLVIKKPYQEHGKSWYQLSLFSFPLVYMSSMQIIYDEVWRNTLNGSDIETSMYNVLNSELREYYGPELKEINTIGSCGWIAPTGKYEEY